MAAAKRMLMGRRMEESRRAAADAVVLEERAVRGRVEFEHRTDGYIKMNAVRAIVAKANAAVKAKIDDRRARLAALLEAEKAQYERDIEATFETPEQAKTRMLAHARKLKEQNEAGRRALVEQLEERRFRLGSDVLRGRASKVMAERVNLDRVAQMQERAVAMRAEAEREAAEAAAQDADSKASAARRRADVEARRRLEEEMRTVLGVQVGVKQELRAREAAWEGEEVRRLLEADAAGARAQAQAERDRRAAARAEFEHVQAFNAREQAARDAASGKEAREDKAALEAALRREAEEDAAEHAAADRRRREALAYQARLAEQAGAQAEDKGWLDGFYAQEADKEWSKRQAKWDAEAAARKALAHDVAATREAQMAERVQRRGMDAAEDARQLQAFRERQAAEDAAEGRRQGERAARAAAAAEATRLQMERDRAAREAVKQQEYLDWRLQSKFDRAYEERVQRMLREGVRQ